MKNLVITTIIAITLIAIAPIANATIVEATPGIIVVPPISGGGGSEPGNPVIVDPPSSISSNMNLPGINIYASANNRNNHANLSLNGTVDGDYLRFNHSRFNININEKDPSQFSLHLSYQFDVLDELYKQLTVDWQQYQNINARGINMYSTNQVENDYDYIWPEYDPYADYQEPTRIRTNDLDLYFWADIAPMDGYRVAEIDYLSLGLNEWSWTYEGGLNGESTLSLSLDADGYFHTPEPATMALLSLGGLVLRRRRRC